MTSLKGKVALVTGGSRGIGAAVCRALAADGATIVVNYRSAEQDAAKVVSAITADGGEAMAIGADVSDLDGVQEMIGHAIDRFGGVDILVNNAGVNRDRLLHTMVPEDWLEVMRTNFGGVFNCTTSLLPHLMAKGDGVIVNVSSVMGERAWIGAANYAASKAAVNAFTRSCALEYARFGIRANAVLPGFTPTDMVGALAEGDSAKGIRKQIPMRRFGEVDQIAKVIRFLCGPESEYLTGALVPVDGGAMTALGLGRVN